MDFHYINNVKYTKIQYFMLSGKMFGSKKFENCTCFFLDKVDQNYEFKELPNMHCFATIVVNNIIYYTKLTNLENTNELGYLNLMKKIMNKGTKRQDRTGTGTTSLFAETLKFELKCVNNSNSSNNKLIGNGSFYQIPVLTTKKVPWKMIIKELLFFLKGYTDTKLLEAENVNIWKGNTSQEFLRKRNLPYNEGDMGPMYGFNWRHFGAEYKGNNSFKKGFDQLKYVEETIKTDPFSRRILMTTFDPSSAELGCLFPCHGLITQFYKSENFLDMSVYNRSQDFFLGLPYNLTSYALLLCIIAKRANLIPRNMTFNMGDSHIYNNHIEQCKQQLKNNIKCMPLLKIDDSIKEKDFSEFKITDFDLIGYFPGPVIKGDMAI